jgi:hypothetical protein
MSQQNEREQIATLLRKIIIDDEFRTSFEADPRQAIGRSGVSLSADAVDKLVSTVELVPSVLAHLDDTDDVSKFFFFSKVVEN